MKYILATFIIGLVLTACSQNSKEYDKFVEKYGRDFRYYCDSGFKLKEQFLYRTAKAPSVFLIDSQECKE